MPNLAVAVNYTFSKSSGYVGLTGAADPLGLMFIPWRGLTGADYTQTGTLTGHAARRLDLQRADLRTERRARSPPTATGAS